MLLNAYRAVTRNSLRAACLTALAACATAATPAPVPAVGEHGETIVYIVRHAEKSTENPSNPDLSAKGYVRADSLASQLKDLGGLRLVGAEPGPFFPKLIALLAAWPHRRTAVIEDRAAQSGDADDARPSLAAALVRRSR